MNDDDNGIRLFFFFCHCTMYKDSNILSLKRVADVFSTQSGLVGSMVGDSGERYLHTWECVSTWPRLINH